MGLTTTVGSSTTSVAINIVQPGDPGDPSYRWYENVDDDAEDECCTGVDDDETGYRYVFCEHFSSTCDGGARIEEDLLIEVAPDDSFSVIVFGSNLCGSDDDARACSYDDTGQQLSCGLWFGEVIGAHDDREIARAGLPSSRSQGHARDLHWVEQRN